MQHVAVICRPGSVLGPCRRNCVHVRCHLAKRQAKSTCPYCGEPCGYDAGICEVPGTKDGSRRRWCHSACLADRLREAGATMLPTLTDVMERVAGRLPDGSPEAAELLHAADEASAFLGRLRGGTH